MVAFNKNPKKIGLRKTFLSKKDRKFYSLFNTRMKDSYERIKQRTDQQLLAFYLAYKNNTKGYLIDLFKKHFLKQAIEREDELYKKYLTLQPSKTIPNKLKKQVLSIYKEEL